MFEVGDKVRWTVEACNSVGAMPDEVFEVLKVASDGSVWTTGRSYGIDPERLTLDGQIEKGMMVRISQKHEDGTSMVVTDVVKVINKGYINTVKYGSFSRITFNVEIISFPVPDKGRAVEFWRTENPDDRVVGIYHGDELMGFQIGGFGASEMFSIGEVMSGTVKWRYLS